VSSNASGASEELEVEDLEDGSDAWAPHAEVHRVHVAGSSVRETVLRSGRERLVKALAKRGERLDVLDIELGSRAGGSGNSTERQPVGQLDLGLIKLNLIGYFESGSLVVGVELVVGSLINTTAQTTIFSFDELTTGLDCLSPSAKKVLETVWKTFLRQLG